MPIPTFDKMLDPLLAIAANEPLTRRAATTAMQQQFIRHVSKRLGVRARDVEWALFRAHEHYQVGNLYRA